jgi:hypothetical protein
MKKSISILVSAAVLICVFAFGQEKPAAGSSPAAKSTGAGSKQAKTRQALSAVPAAIARSATVKDWDGSVLKQGNDDYVCMRGPPAMKGIGPMCLDKVWQGWADAWMNTTLRKSRRTPN